MEHRMNPFRSDLCQRLKHKETLMHGWMGERKPGLLEDEIVVKQKIEIEHTRAFLRHKSAISPHFPLDFEHFPQEDQRS